METIRTVCNTCNTETIVMTYRQAVGWAVTNPPCAHEQFLIWLGNEVKIQVEMFENIKNFVTKLYIK